MEGSVMEQRWLLARAAGMASVAGEAVFAMSSHTLPPGTSSVRGDYSFSE